jgi:hypothetical protein
METRKMKEKGQSTENSAAVIMTQQANEKKYTLFFQFNTERTNLGMEQNYGS